MIIGNLKVAGENDESIVKDTYSSYPLKFVQSEQWESHVTTGIFNVDRCAEDSHIKIQLDEGVHAPASNKAACDKNQNLSATVGSDSLLVFTPDAASFKNFTETFMLEKTGSLAAVVWHGADAPTRKINLYHDGSPIALNEEEDETSSVPLSEDEQIGCTVILAGPRAKCMREELSAEHDLHTPNEHTTVMRFTACDTQNAYETLTEVLKPLVNELPGVEPYKHKVLTAPECSGSTTPLCRSRSNTVTSGPYGRSRSNTNTGATTPCVRSRSNTTTVPPTSASAPAGIAACENDKNMRDDDNADRSITPIVENECPLAAGQQ